MSKHTPGKWRAGYLDEADRKNQMIVRAEDVDGQPYIAICPNPVCGDLEANAQLIAAAPDLLAVCKWSLEHFEGGGPELVPITERLRAAIAKAKGKKE